MTSTSQEAAGVPPHTRQPHNRLAVLRAERGIGRRPLALRLAVHFALPVEAISP
ncbi:hypothetical protein [Kineococcus esterisolvens]|uniref:hypothetical protein n=1 Tax=unclassified Kineococcus TaxID=2621656 RepID=UPI003D7C4272